MYSFQVELLEVNSLRRRTCLSSAYMIFEEFCCGQLAIDFPYPSHLYQWYHIHTTPQVQVKQPRKPLVVGWHETTNKSQQNKANENRVYILKDIRHISWAYMKTNGC